MKMIIEIKDEDIEREVARHYQDENDLPPVPQEKALAYIKERMFSFIPNFIQAELEDNIEVLMFDIWEEDLTPVERVAPEV